MGESDSVIAAYSVCRNQTDIIDTIKKKRLTINGKFKMSCQINDLILSDKEVFSLPDFKRVQTLTFQPSAYLRIMKVIFLVHDENSQIDVIAPRDAALHRVCPTYKF